MANTCGFGQIKDGRFTEICIGGSRVVDSNRNINANKVTARSLCARNLTLTNPCLPTIKTNKIQEKVSGGGISMCGEITTDQDLIVGGNIKVTGNVSSKDVPLIATAAAEANTSVQIEPLFPAGELMVTSPPCNGVIEQVLPNGMVTYNSSPGFIGTDFYTYTINDLCGVKRCVTQLVCVQNPVVPPIANCTNAEFFESLPFTKCANVLSIAVPGTFPIDYGNVTITDVFVPETGYDEEEDCPNTAQEFTAFVDENEEICLTANIFTNCVGQNPVEVTYTVSDTMGNPSNEAVVCFLFST